MLFGLSAPFATLLLRGARPQLLVGLRTSAPARGFWALSARASRGPVDNNLTQTLSLGVFGEQDVLLVAGGTLIHARYPDIHHGHGHD
jgi:hypothetical protein